MVLQGVWRSQTRSRGSRARSETAGWRMNEGFRVCSASTAKADCAQCGSKPAGLSVTCTNLHFVAYIYCNQQNVISELFGLANSEGA